MARGGLRVLVLRARVAGVSGALLLMWARCSRARSRRARGSRTWPASTSSAMCVASAQTPRRGDWLFRVARERDSHHGGGHRDGEECVCARVLAWTLRMGATCDRPWRGCVDEPRTRLGPMRAAQSYTSKYVLHRARAHGIRLRRPAARSKPRARQAPRMPTVAARRVHMRRPRWRKRPHYESPQRGTPRARRAMTWRRIPCFRRLPQPAQTDTLATFSHAQWDHHSRHVPPTTRRRSRCRSPRQSRALARCESLRRRKHARERAAWSCTCARLRPRCRPTSGHLPARRTQPALARRGSRTNTRTSLSQTNRGRSASPTASSHQDCSARALRHAPSIGVASVRMPHSTIPSPLVPHQRGSPRDTNCAVPRACTIAEQEPQNRPPARTWNNAALARP